MKQTLAQIQEETLKRFLADFEYRGFSELGWWTKDEECRPMQIHHIEAFLTQSNLRVIEKVKEMVENLKVTGSPQFEGDDVEEKAKLVQEVYDKMIKPALLSHLIETK